MKIKYRKFNAYFTASFDPLDRTSKPTLQTLSLIHIPAPHPQENNCVFFPGPHQLRIRITSAPHTQSAPLPNLFRIRSQHAILLNSLHFFQIVLIFPNQLSRSNCKNQTM